MIYNFGDDSLDTDRQELLRGAELVVIEPQVFDLLHYLIRHRERVVSKDDLIAHVWKGRIVSDSTLTSRITSARRAIGDSGDEQRLIRTVARRGFRFVGEVRESGGKPAPLVKEDVAVHAASGAGLRALSDKPSIAVLPFSNMSGDPEQDYFSDGITEDIITALSRFRWFLVIARSSTFVYKGQGVDVKQVGRELGARYVLEGSVRKSGQRMRITAQLIDAVSGGHIWAEQYDRELTDIFAVQDEITARVAAAIQSKLWVAEELRGRKRSVDDLGAWDSGRTCRVPSIQAHPGRFRDRDRHPAGGGAALSGLRPGARLAGLHSYSLRRRGVDDAGRRSRARCGAYKPRPGARSGGNMGARGPWRAGRLLRTERRRRSPLSDRP